jgi:ABC-type phosphate/phosphonate transport system substrate-binding protein
MRIGAEQLALLTGQVLVRDGTEVVVTLGAYTPRQRTSPARLAQYYAPLVKYLQAGLTNAAGAPVLFELLVYNNPSYALEGVLKGEVDLVRLDPAAYVLARQKVATLTPIVAENCGGQPELRGAFFTRFDSGVRRLSITNLMNRSFAFGDRESALGHYVPEAELVAAGIRACHLKRITNIVGRAVVNAVHRDAVEVGVTDLASLRRFIKAGVPLRLIHEFSCPTCPWVVTQKLDRNIVAALQARLLACRDTNTLAALDFELTGFLPVQASDYDPLAGQLARARLFDEAP